MRQDNAPVQDMEGKAAACLACHRYHDMMRSNAARFHHDPAGIMLLGADISRRATAVN